MQEEPSNSGAYFFVCPRLKRILTNLNFMNKTIKYIGRRSIASSATGVVNYSIKEEAEILNFLK